MQDIDGKIIMQWNNDYWKLSKKVFNNGKRNILQAKKFMEENYIYTGDNRNAFTYLMYAHPKDIDLENKLYLQITEAIKLGHGKDFNFEKVFR